MERSPDVFHRNGHQVRVARDAAQSVWYVHESAIPGLHAEAATYDELVAIVTDVAPGRILANCPEPGMRGVRSVPSRIEHRVDAKLAVAG